MKTKEIPDKRPVLRAKGDLKESSEAAWKQITGWSDPTDPDRFLALMGGEIVRLDHRSEVVAAMLKTPHVRHVLAEVIRWVDDDGNPCPPPSQVATDILAYPKSKIPLPDLERIISVPVLAADGSIHDTTGYDAGTRCFYQPEPGLLIETVKRRPTAADVNRAVDMLHYIVQDFPFSGPDDGAVEKAHAFDAMLTPFVRAMIDGQTPLHLFDAPTPGSGKTLLAECLAIPAIGGRRLRSMVEGGNAEEWRKRLTATLLKNTEYVLLDNIRTRLDSGALASILTAGVATDRLLNFSRMVELHTQCCWLATGNNVVMSDEMFRRTVRTRLDSGWEHPEERSGWAIPKLKRYVHEHRGELVWACLTLGREWVVAKRPRFSGQELGMFEEYSEVIGGILEHVGLGTILGNRSEFRSSVTHDDEGPQAFLTAAWKQFGKRRFKTAEAAELARAHLALDETADARSIGFALNRLVDRPITGLTLRQSGMMHGNVRGWHIDAIANNSHGTLAALKTRYDAKLKAV